jgi:hypothetical protein
VRDALALDLPDDDFALADEPWFMEPKDKDPRGEFARQLDVVTTVRRDAPGVTVFAVPNAGKVSDWQRIRRWREGAMSGALDLVFHWRPARPGDRGVFFAEMKDGRDMPTREQRDELNRLYRQGHGCGVYRRPETLLAHLREAGVPFL